LINIFWFYFKEVQPPHVRVMHMTVLVLVVMQLISSNLISFDALGRVSESPAFFIGSWTHFSIGIALGLVGFLFGAIEITKHGILNV